MDVTFQSLKELYERIGPALRTKKREMIREGYTYIKEEDIWNYLKEIKWKNSKNLTLFDMVEDVLHTDSMVIDAYLKKELRTIKRRRNLEEDEEDLYA